jgi:glycosyltransferase involved in cell wall biosynthesis
MVGGGAEKVLVNLLNLINYKKYEVALCIVMGEGELLNDIHSNVKKVVLFKSSLFARIVFYLYRRVGIEVFIRNLANRKITDNYDVGLSFIDSVYSDLLIFLGPKVKRKITVIHSSYKSYPLRYKNTIGKFRSEVLSRLDKFDSIVAVSNDSLKEFRDLFGEYPDMRVIYNPLNSKEVNRQAIAYDPNLPKGYINVVAVGRLTPVKNYECLVRACSLLKKNGYKFKLKILGTGTEKEKIQTLINALGLNDDVKLIGFVDNPYPYIKKSDIFVMSSISEGLPTALCEALLLGRPVVVTNCTGCREIVDNGKYGIMTDQNEQSLFRGIARLIDDAELREKFSNASIKRSRIFSDAATLRQYEDLFDGK